MAISQSARITILLVIDVLFFFLELLVGYGVGSLALVADSFHMLNDVLSLVVALYAIKMSSTTEADTRYTYGWHRAEILAALVNGVFLLALCFSIFLEAMERFFSTPEVGNPKLVVCVGACGLVSNIVGLFLFRGHAHPDSHADHRSSPKTLDDSITNPSRARSPAGINAQPQPVPTRPRSDSFGHPAALRASFNQAAEKMRRERSPSPFSRRARQQQQPTQSIDTALEDDHSERVASNSSDATLIRESSNTHGDRTHERTPLLVPTDRSENVTGHRNAGGHSHGSMNMKAILLHVLGDALGNVGVIASGLIIWLTTWQFKFYCDPIISLVITVIIFSSALPLVRSTAFILLQGVPPTISLEEVRDAILQVDGVISLHELHIWQLSESKVVASVHITASRDYDFMDVAADIQKALHHHGIHSSTIQPEYNTDPSRTPNLPRGSSGSCSSCLINCPSNMLCSSEDTCCPPATGV